MKLMSMLFGDAASTLAVTEAQDRHQSLQALKQRLRMTVSRVLSVTVCIGCQFLNVYISSYVC